jgi:hypothetical protein
MRKVPLTGSCDATTIAGIEAFQRSMKAKAPGTVVDGKMSQAKAVSYGGGAWSIAQLNFFIRKSCQDKWPRLQDFPDCPALLKKKKFPEIM